MWRYVGADRPDFAERPGEGQESVWDYPRPPVLAPDSRAVRVVHEGADVALTHRAVRVLETASPPTFYVPEDDVDLSRLVELEGPQSVCEWKGAARYWALALSRERTMVGWSYPSPSRAFKSIEGFFSFYPGRINCYVDDEHVQPQPGGFYGGWITSEVVGPFKGEPGTGHW
ncbi:MAG: DUF427 domain-containing protein [Gammaproteobacteria bacterium]|nr:DUF427 domain-containing protein [Gammaproteobacteria bacterium]